MSVKWIDYEGKKILEIIYSGVRFFNSRNRNYWDAITPGIPFSLLYDREGFHIDFYFTLYLPWKNLLVK